MKLRLKSLGVFGRINEHVAKATAPSSVFLERLPFLSRLLVLQNRDDLHDAGSVKVTTENGVKTAHVREASDEECNHLVHIHRHLLIIMRLTRF